MKDKILVIIQSTGIFVIVGTGPVIATGILLILELLGIVLGLWAIQTIGIGNFNITPNPKPKSKLTNTGPYKWIRHPMYAAIFLTLLPIVVWSFSGMRLVTFTILIADLHYKMNYEEKLLQEKVKGYKEYIKETKRIIPFIY